MHTLIIASVAYDCIFFESVVWVRKKHLIINSLIKKKKHWSRKDSFLMFLRSNTVIFLTYPNWFLLQDLSITLSNFCCSIIHSMNKGNAVPVSSSFTATYPFDKQKLLPFINSKKKKKFECSTYAFSTTFQSCHLLIYYYWLLLLQCI